MYPNIKTVVVIYHYSVINNKIEMLYNNMYLLYNDKYMLYNEHNILYNALYTDFLVIQCNNTLYNER